MFQEDLNFSLEVFNRFLRKNEAAFYQLSSCYATCLHETSWRWIYEIKYLHKNSLECLWVWNKFAYAQGMLFVVGPERNWWVIKTIRIRFPLDSPIRNFAIIWIQLAPRRRTQLRRMPVQTRRWRMTNLFPDAKSPQRALLRTNWRSVIGNHYLIA